MEEAAKTAELDSAWQVGIISRSKDRAEKTIERRKDTAADLEQTIVGKGFGADRVTQTGQFRFTELDQWHI